MAIYGKGGVTEVTFVAAEDLTNKQYYPVELNATEGKVNVPLATADIPIGIITNEPGGTGSEVTVALIGAGGLCPVILAGTLSIGAVVAVEYNSGKAQTAISSQYPIGVLVKGGAEDELGVVSLGSVIVKA